MAPDAGRHSSSCSRSPQRSLAAPAAGLERRPLRRPRRRLADLRAGHARGADRPPRPPRRRDRPLHRALGPGRARAPGAAALARRRGLPLGLRRRRARRAARPRHRRRRHAARDAPLGERRPRLELGADAGRRLRRLRDGGRGPLPVGARSGRSGTSPTSAAGCGRRPRRRTYAACSTRPTRRCTRADRGTRVGGGVTAPRGNAGGVSPVQWIRGMGAAKAASTPTRTIPYPLRPRVETPVVAAAARGAGARRSRWARSNRLVLEVTRAFGPKRIWLTEYGYQTNPPDRTILGVSYERQARYLSEAALLAYRTPYVDMLINFLVQDDALLAALAERLLHGRGRGEAVGALVPAAARAGLAAGLRAPCSGDRCGRGAGRQQYRLRVLRGGSWQMARPVRAYRRARRLHDQRHGRPGRARAALLAARPDDGADARDPCTALRLRRLNGHETDRQQSRPYASVA